MNSTFKLASTILFGGFDKYVRVHSIIANLFQRDLRAKTELIADTGGIYAVISPAIVKNLN